MIYISYISSEIIATIYLVIDTEGISYETIKIEQ